MKELRGLLAELSSTWLKRRKIRALSAEVPKSPRTVDPGRPPRAEHAARQRPAHKPKPLSSRDVASNM